MPFTTFGRRRRVVLVVADRQRQLVPGHEVVLVGVVDVRLEAGSDRRARLGPPPGPPDNAIDEAICTVPSIGSLAASGSTQSSVETTHSSPPPSSPSVVSGASVLVRRLGLIGRRGPRRPRSRPSPRRRRRVRVGRCIGVRRRGPSLQNHRRRRRHTAAAMSDAAAIDGGDPSRSSGHVGAPWSVGSVDPRTVAAHSAGVRTLVPPRPPPAPRWPGRARRPAVPAGRGTMTTKRLAMRRSRPTMPNGATKMTTMMTTARNERRRRRLELEPVDEDRVDDPVVMFRPRGCELSRTT